MKKFFKNNLVILLSLFIIFFVGFSFENKTEAALSCSEYGLMAYEDYSGYCKCMSGYVFQDNIFGDSQCVSGSSVCYDKYGYGARYDSLSGSCECSYGYVLGKDSIGRTQCISENDACENQYGYNARSTYGGKCECSYGYVFNENNQCEYGNTVCRREHGLYSSFDSLSNKCKCDDGYTADDDNQCVKKQNNVYFILKEIDTNQKKAIIKSDYDFRYSLVSYGAGCLPSSFRRYLNRQIVVNLGTDFSLDSWDKIVLQDDDEVCDITKVERADSSTTLVIERVEDVFYYTSPTSPPSPKNNVNQAPQETKIKQVTSSDDNNMDTNDEVETEASSIPKATETLIETKIDSQSKPWFKRMFEWFF